MLTAQLQDGWQVVCSPVEWNIETITNAKTVKPFINSKRSNIHTSLGFKIVHIHTMYIYIQVKKKEKNGKRDAPTELNRTQLTDNQKQHVCSFSLYLWCSFLSLVSVSTIVLLLLIVLHQGCSKNSNKNWTILVLLPVKACEVNFPFLLLQTKFLFLHKEQTKIIEDYSHKLFLNSLQVILRLS